MEKRYTPTEQKEIINRHQCGETIINLARELNISRTTLYSWKKKFCISKNPVNMSNYKRLVERVIKQENMIKILQTTSSVANAPSSKCYDIITELSVEYNINTLCEALKVARGSYYNHIYRAKKENSLANRRREELKPIIEEIFNESKQIYGASKVAAIMKDRGFKVSQEFVSNIMHENGWFSIRTSAKTLYMQNQKRKENILNQNFTVKRPNEVWVSDVTYFKFSNKTYYICVIIDLYARKVVASKTSTKNSTQLVKSTFKYAYETRQITDALLFHTDRGSNYTSKTFVRYLNSLNIIQSFSRKSMPYDNSVCETFFSNMKREELYRTNYRSEKEFLQSVKEYILFYNSKRPHATNMNLTPDKKESKFLCDNNVFHD